MAARQEFARYGYYGGSTERIAAACEISQPYVLRLFGSKLKLYLATLEAVHESIEHRWARALEGIGGAGTMVAALFLSWALWRSR